MPILKILLSFLLTCLVFFAIDLVWLGLVAKEFYAKQMGSLMADKVNWVAALVFYLMYVAGILLFVVYPAAEKSSIWNAVLMGGLFGLVCYATYDLTNLATMRDFPLTMVFIDLAWGMVLTASVSAAGYGIVRWLMGS